MTVHFVCFKDNPEKTAAVFCGDFYVTGDRGWMDEEGYLWFVARSDDVIISSGFVHFCVHLLVLTVL